MTKNPDSTIVDSFISAELPDKETDKEGFELVEQHMMHGPCGMNRPYLPCMQNGECSKKYPRAFTDNTTVDQSGFILYRRRNDQSKFVVKGDTKLDNRHVVPHNIHLLKKYKAHINVAWCCKTSAIKYLFKYITKGVDRATFVIEKMPNGATDQGFKTNANQDVDEIIDFLDCRFLSACEAAWRILAFHIHYHKPSVMRLRIHLPNQQSVMFKPTENLESVISREDVGKTMFTEWMTACKIYPEACTLTFIEFPKYFVWKSTEKTWTPRKQGTTIARVVNIHPSAGDLYYLRIFVNVVTGATCFDDLYTVGDKLYTSFQDACYARGLLDDDKEWHDLVEEADY